MSTKINVQKCTGCGECKEACPVSPNIFEIKLIKGKRIAITNPINQKACIDCGACAVACPEDAIRRED